MSTVMTGFYVSGGTLRPDAPSYVERQADADLYAGLLRGEFCYVLTARQMGKSSLMVRTAARLRREGVAVVVLDLTALGQNLSPEQWYGGLLRHLGRQLDLEDELEEFQLDTQRLSPLQRWMVALHEVVLPRVPGRIVIFVDEIDAVRSLPFSTDEFFAAIRECYNRRTEDPVFTRLTFCLLGVATPSDLIQDTRTTPFNIGRRIELTDFTEEEAAPLAECLDGETGGWDVGANKALLPRILYWTGGHPYLTQRLCQAVAMSLRSCTEHEARSPTHSALAAEVDRLCESLFLSASAREQDDNLLFVRERLLRGEADPASVLDLYERVWRRQRVRLDDTNLLVSLLRLSGITRVVAGELRVRNRIYERVFDRAWVTAHMPDAELRRQRAAYRRGLVRATAVAGLVVAVMATLAAAAVRSEARAQRLAEARQQALAEARSDRDRAVRAVREVRQWLTAAQQARQMAAQRAQQARASAQAAKMSARRAERQQQRAQQAAVREAAQRRRAEVQQRHADQAKHLADINAERAHRQERLAQAAAAQERAARRRSVRLLYDADVQLAAQAWESENGTAQVMHAYLTTHTPLPHEEDLRGFEWRYLWSLLYRTPVTFWLHASPAALAVSRDDGVITIDTKGRLTQWDRARPRSIRRLDLPAHAPGQFALAPDGATVAVGAADGAVKILDLPSGRERRVLRASPHPIVALHFLRDGKTLITQGSEGVIRLWDVATGQETAAIPGVDLRGIDLRGAFSPDGRSLAQVRGPFGERVFLSDWQARPAKETWLGAVGSTIQSLAYSPDGRTLAAGDSFGGVTFWDLVSRKKIGELISHQAQVSSQTFSPDGRTLAAGFSDGLVEWWDVRTRQRRRRLKGHTARVVLLKFAADGNSLASGSDDGTARLWNLSTFDVSRIVATKAQGSAGAAYSPDGRWLGTAHLDGTAQIRDAVTGRLALTLRAASHRVTSLTFSPDGRTFATGGADSQVKLWDLATGQERRRFVGLPGPPDRMSRNAVASVAFSPDGRLLAAGFGNMGLYGPAPDQGIKLWEVASGREMRSLRGHRCTVPALAFSPDGKILATGGHDRSVKLWRVSTGEAIRTLACADDVKCVAFSPDGKRLAIAMTSAAIQLWEMDTGRPGPTLQGHSYIIYRVAFSPDGRTLASASGDRTVKLWDAISGRETCTLGHPNPVDAVAFSPDGNRLTSVDGAVHVWEVASWPEITTALAEERAP
jgi:WD40 repeat protein